MTSITERLNGKVRLIAGVAAGAIFLVTTTVMIEGRYAKASEFAEVQQATSTILEVMKIQAETRRALLELKAANGEITPEQQVELAGLVRAIAKMP